MAGKVEVLKEFFSTPNKPVTNQELMDLRKADKESFDELAEAAARALGMTLDK